MSKQVITVRGSEDGILGVASNLKQAVAIACRCGYHVTYNEALKEKKNVNWYFVIDLSDGADVAFEYFYLETGR